MLTRIVTAVVLAILMTLVILFVPYNIFNGIVLLIIMAGLYEFFRITLPPESVYREAAWIYGVASAVSLIILKSPQIFAGVLIAGLFVVALIHMRAATAFEGTTSRIGLTVLGVVYLSATLPFWGFLRGLPHGKALIFMAIASAAMGDTFAMFAGKAFGRHKFAPLASPNKTLEGFLAGFVGSVLSVFVVKLIGWKELPFYHVVAIGVLIGFVGPFGDLIESMFKRDHHVKDSGTIIPGHGGILDRLDAMIFTGPAVFIYAKFLLI